MQHFPSRLFLPLLVAVLAAAPASAGGVRVVEPSGTLNFATIQEAVDAAPEGGLVLVAAGSYPGFVVDGKSVHVSAVPGAQVRITGTVRVVSTSFDQDVSLTGLRIAPAIQTVAALRIVQCAGAVFVQDCGMRPPDRLPDPCDPTPPLAGGAGATVDFSPRAVFSRCTLVGGAGAPPLPTDPADCATAGRGGDGLVATHSIVAVYDCTTIGGAGGSSHGVSGAGGSGSRFGSSEAFLSWSTARGGPGGANTSLAPGSCGGPGGAAAESDTQVYSSGLTSYVGEGGAGITCDGPSGTWFAGTGSISGFPFPKSAAVDPLVLPDLASWTVAYDAPSGAADRVFLLASHAPAPSLQVTFNPVGMFVLDTSALEPSAFLGFADAFGLLTATVAAPDLPPGSSFSVRFAQVAARQTNHVVHAGTPAVLFLLDRDSGPDCDGNGTSDLVDVIEDPALDANQNLIPDSCPGG